MPKLLILCIEGHRHDLRTQTGPFKSKCLIFEGPRLTKNKTEGSLLLYWGFVKLYLPFSIFGDDGWSTYLIS